MWVLIFIYRFMCIIELVDCLQFLHNDKISCKNLCLKLLVVVHLCNDMIKLYDWFKEWCGVSMEWMLQMQSKPTRCIRVCVCVCMCMWCDCVSDSKDLQWQDSYFIFLMVEVYLSIFIDKSSSAVTLMCVFCFVFRLRCSIYSSSWLISLIVATPTAR